MKTRAERRRLDRNKAARKKDICETHYGFAYYDNIHQYSKNKIHCSCALCRAKTRETGHTISEIRKIESLENQKDEI